MGRGSIAVGVAGLCILLTVALNGSKVGPWAMEQARLSAALAVSPLGLRELEDGGWLRGVMRVPRVFPVK